MEATFLPRIKQGTPVFTIENHKIEVFYVKKASIKEGSLDLLGRNISHSIILTLDRYKAGLDSYQVTRLLSQCFLTREELIKNL